MSASLFQSLRVELLQLLNVSNLKPHLLRNGLLTFDESEKIRLLEMKLTNRQLAEELLDMVVRKGANSEQLFLQSIQESIAGDDLHRGHKDLATLIMRNLQERQQSVQCCSKQLPETSTPADINSSLPSGSQILPESVFPVQFHQPFVNPSSIFNPIHSQYANLPYTGFGPGSIPYVDGYSDYHSNTSPSLGDFSALDMLDWKEAEAMKHKIVVESQKIIRQYSDFVMNVYHLLESCNVDYELVKMKILHMGQPGSSVDMPEVSKSKNLKQLITAFHLYSSWFNYEVVKVVAEDFGGKEGNKLVAEYETILATFAKRFIIKCPQFMPNPTIPPHFEGFVMKVEKEYFSSTAQDLVLFKSTIVKLTGIEPYCLLLRSVEEGCIKITWLIPSVYVPLVLEKLAISWRFLAAIDVTSFYIAGKHFNVPSYLIQKQQSSTNFDGSNLSDESSLVAERRGSLDSNATSILTSYSLSTSMQTDSDHKSASFRRGVSDSSLISSSDTFGGPDNATNEDQAAQSEKNQGKAKVKKKKGPLQTIKRIYHRMSSSKGKSSSSPPHTAEATFSSVQNSTVADGDISYDSSCPSFGLEAIPNPSLISGQPLVVDCDEEATFMHDQHCHVQSDSSGYLTCEDIKSKARGSEEELLTLEQLEIKDTVLSYVHYGSAHSVETNLGNGRGKDLLKLEVVQGTDSAAPSCGSDDSESEFRVRSHSLVSANTYQTARSNNNYFHDKRKSLYESFLTETSGYGSQKASQLTLCNSDYKRSFSDDLISDEQHQ